MEDTSKYLIHATVTADGVVERSDVVGAIFGQTEGLLGDQLDLRDLRHSQKVGRIDVDISSSRGQSTGEVTIATNLDKVETATLAAALETITRVGPCRAELEVRELEDVRAAKRKQVVERAKELLRTGFEDTIMSSEEILAEVRQQVRVEDVTEYEGLPAGPRVADSDAIIVVEGRADVLTLLKYGVKNAIAVEGTNVPETVAKLTTHRTVTAFLDGDRGGDLILEELSQVGEIDYVAFAPAGRSVEDLDHHELFTALRNKVPYEAVAGTNAPREAVAATDGSTTPAPTPDGSAAGRTDAEQSTPTAGSDPETGPTGEPLEVAAERPVDDDGADGAAADGPKTVYDHASEVIRKRTDRVRLVDADGTVLEECPAAEAYEAVEGVDDCATIVYDGILSQRLLDVAADRGVERVVARALGQFTKRPADVRVHAITDVAEDAPGSE